MNCSQLNEFEAEIIGKILVGEDLKKIYIYNRSFHCSYEFFYRKEGRGTGIRLPEKNPV